MLEMTKMDVTRQWISAIQTVLSIRWNKFLISLFSNRYCANARSFVTNT